MTLNTRSICNKVENVVSLMDEHNVDVALISETWLQSEKNTTTAELINFGYKLHHSHRCNLDKERGCGGAIIAKNNFDLFPCTRELKSFTSIEYVIGI